jgi:hypothetical protein
VVRFYNITLSATDVTDNTGSVVCQVGVIPNNFRRSMRDLQSVLTIKDEKAIRAKINGTETMYQLASLSWSFEEE